MSTEIHPEEANVRVLYHNLLSAWNRRSAVDMASLFTESGSLVGFDGSQVNGLEAIGEHLAPIFLHHPTAEFISKVREVRFLSADVALLRAVVGMIPRGKNDIMPEVNAVQSMVAVKTNDHWRVALFQNTPAAYHGQPEASERLTQELREELKASKLADKSSQGF